MKVEESLNVTFDETPPSPKTSPLEDDELVEEEAIKVRIYQKSQENSQKRASTDTRIRRVQKEVKESKSKPEKSSLSQIQSRWVKSVFPRDSLAQDQAQATSAMVKAQIIVGFYANLLTELAHHVTSKNDMLAILRCPQINPTAQDQYLIIEGIDG
ncbi:hypothetical protein Tco_0396563 [Tanacetum coccineum]